MVNQSKLEVISSSWPKAEENQCEIVTIGFGRRFYFLIGSKSGASFLSQSCNGVGHKRHVTGSDLPSLDRIQMFASSIFYRTMHVWNELAGLHDSHASWYVNIFRSLN